jgi:hypothetical protein
MFDIGHRGSFVKVSQPGREGSPSVRIPDRGEGLVYAVRGMGMCRTPDRDIHAKKGAHRKAGTLQRKIRIRAEKDDRRGSGESHKNLGD